MSFAFLKLRIVTKVISQAPGHLQKPGTLLSINQLYTPNNHYKHTNTIPQKLHTENRLLFDSWL